MFFPTYSKLSKDTFPTNADLYVHIIYFNSSKLRLFLERFRIGARMHMRPCIEYKFISNSKTRYYLSKNLDIYNNICTYEAIFEVEDFRYFKNNLKDYNKT